MLSFIKRRATGSPAEFADRIGVSESTLFENINDLKDKGADIVYSSAYQSYILLNDFKIAFGCSNTNRIPK